MNFLSAIFDLQHTIVFSKQTAPADGIRAIRREGRNAIGSVNIALLILLHFVVSLFLIVFLEFFIFLLFFAFDGKFFNIFECLLLFLFEKKKKRRNASTIDSPWLARFYHHEGKLCNSSVWSCRKALVVNVTYMGTHQPISTNQLTAVNQVINPSGWHTIRYKLISLMRPTPYACQIDD